ncbi:EAL domain-containing protein [Catenovulum sp. SM1970]|uniref:EAL domain-containing protein n=1 Tax=Marinifaba aquimaris TaxID=2741323 RepID=UPI0015737DD5|nr:EAL domain-containing protein [Marinifaba aquimaris]NTS77693.1 EAL domain-containing protein [Marinifaba aquimaris]
MLTKFKSLLANSISLKVTISVIISYLIVAGVSWILLASLRQDYLKQKIETDLPKQTQLAKTYLQEHFQSLEELAKLANVTLSRELFLLPAKHQSQLVQSIDGSYRQDDGDSAAFLAKHTPMSSYQAAVFRNTKDIFSAIAPIVKNGFFNFYFISKDDFIRISPGQWATQIEADHKFSGDVFYSIATPELNPERLARWTPVYYDDIWQQWMISFIVPLYIDDEFIGITGSDVFVSSIGKLLENESGQQLSDRIFIFDKDGNVIFHPEYEDVLTSNVATMNTLLDSQGLVAEPLQNLVDDIIKQEITHANDVKSLSADKQNFWISVNPLVDLPWFIGVFEAQSVNDPHFNEYKIKVVITSLLMGATLSFLLYWLINKTLLTRLNNLALKVKEHKDGKIDLSSELNLSDEVGVVAQALQEMTSQNHKLLTEMQLEIKDKTAAEIKASRFFDVITYSDIAIALLEKDMRINYVNPKMAALLQSSEDALLGEKVDILFDPITVWQLDEAQENLEAGKSWHGELLLNSDKTEPIWLAQSFTPIKEKYTGNIHYLASSHDISSIKQNQKAMEKLAYYDTLTGLCNRGFFKTQLAKAFEMSKRGHHSFALLYFDLDQFKRINDTLGHDAGDELLVVISSRLKSRLRAEDSVARLGGDEFAIIVNAVSEPDKVSNLARGILSLIQEPIPINNAEILVSASIGITLAPNDADNIDILLRNADLAMYQAKEAGRNTYYFYDNKLDLEVKEYALIESQLRDALNEEQFVLYYQPQVDLSSGRVFGFEALVRWIHPERGLVPPDKFIPIAEQTGLIVPLGEWVMSTACEFIGRLNRYFEQDYTVAVNLSMRQFKDKNLVKTIESCIQQHQILPQWLDVEVTETMLVGDVKESISHMNKIKELGIKLSIDDFGTGYSSLSYLKQFPLDTLKVDRAFVKDIPQDRDDMAITAAIIAMAQKLNLEIIAEGVETLEQIDFLIGNACAIGQGYFFSRPLPEELLFEFVEEFKEQNIIAIK